MSRIVYLAGALVLISAPAAAETLRVRGSDCAQLVRHTPSADATYLPGVDVHGRPVAPADLDSGPVIRPPEQIVFDIAVDLRRYGVAAKSPLYDPRLSVGTVRVEADGRVFFNDRPLESPDIAALTALCRERLK